MTLKQILVPLSLTTLICSCGGDNAAQTPAQQPDSSSQKMSTRVTQAQPVINALIAEMTLDEKLSLLHGNSKFTIASIERLGVHEMWMSDGPHTVRKEIMRHTWDEAGWQNDQATYLPPLTMVAASWNRDMARLHGDVLGSEARHRGKDLILGPGVNLAQNPLNGRNFEYMGEDPYLAAQLATEEIRAIQANDVGATVKHFALNTQELQRNTVNATPDERTLREVYLPAFEAAVKDAGVLAVMGSYNQVYGTNANQSKLLTQDILRAEWDYPYILLTDWNVNINTLDAARNGLDIEMGTERDYKDFFFAEPLKRAVEAGEIEESLVDTKVKHILQAQYAMGMYDKSRLAGERNTSAHQQAALTIAEDGITLLKNDGLLPLDAKALKSVLVVGPNIDQRHGGGGGSSEAKALYEVTPIEGIAKLLGDGVQVNAMRIGGGPETAPIAGDYIVSRHWTGTTAWNIDFYADATRSEKIGTDWRADSQFKAESATVATLTATVKPRTQGEHRFVLSGSGKVSLRVDGKTIASTELTAGQPFSVSQTLSNAQDYQIALDYQGQGQVLLGWDSPDRLFNTLADALAAAEQADAVIYVGGLSHADDRESIDRADLTLPGSQNEEIPALLAANKNTAILLIGGSPAEMPWIDNARAVVWGWYGGMEAGTAYANTLFGLNNPSGKLPMTFPKSLSDSAAIALGDYGPEQARYSEGVMIGHRWFDQQNIEPLFPFGHGLSYTEFSYSNLQLSDNSVTPDGTLTVSVDVTNTGKRAGAEVIQLYLSDDEASVKRPLRELKGFAKVALKAGETKTAQFKITPRDRSFWDVETHNWKAEDGQFTVHIGASSRDLRLAGGFVQND